VYRFRSFTSMKLNVMHQADQTTSWVPLSRFG
jgi:hypothetical protein